MTDNPRPHRKTDDEFEAEIVELKEKIKELEARVAVLEKREPPRTPLSEMVF